MTIYILHVFDIRRPIGKQKLYFVVLTGINQNSYHQSGLTSIQVASLSSKESYYQMHANSMTGVSMDEESSLLSRLQSNGQLNASTTINNSLLCALVSTTPSSLSQICSNAKESHFLCLQQSPNPSGLNFLPKVVEKVQKQRFIPSFSDQTLSTS